MVVQERIQESGTQCTFTTTLKGLPTDPSLSARGAAPSERFSRSFSNCERGLWSWPSLQPHGIVNRQAGDAFHHQNERRPGPKCHPRAFYKYRRWCHAALRRQTACRALLRVTAVSQGKWVSMAFLGDLGDLCTGCCLCK